ncbi:FCD domain-containing protein [Paraburkholderia sp. CNPSo 3272]|uniref:FadR/GntR family transcriptional regulator n=1 Tax=Paraburkholderia sp. CNPSo 3272 TaxID=2940931 RepID=UPI0020B7EB03|nr:FCD domain-containing protein [Paraburkholderia sp. CNPSo 3272]MCP3722420.1 FCD domain-containing protein [Paraburkholderia sp. CNPSo 3272]
MVQATARMEPDQSRNLGGSALRAPEVRSQLAAMIQSGTIAVGERLPTERELMVRFGVSRSVVREAITDLSNKGLIKTRPGCRPVVCKPDLESALGALSHFVAQLTTRNEQGIRSLFETRMFMEAALARWAALHARREDIVELEAALAANKAAIGHPGRFEETDIAFHHVFYTMQRNPIFPALHHAYVQWLYHHWRSIVTTPAIDLMNYTGHAAIVSAVIARDPDGAEEAVRRHLNAAWEHVRSTFDFATSNSHTPADARAEDKQRSA